MKLMVLRANGAVLRMQCAPFVILLSPLVVRLGRLLIFLVERFSVKKRQILEHVYRYVKRLIISINNSEVRRKFSTKK
jgi:hypothetical protein